MSTKEKYSDRRHNQRRHDREPDAALEIPLLDQNIRQDDRRCDPRRQSERQNVSFKVLSSDHAFSVFTNVDYIEYIKIGKKEYKVPNKFHKYECQLRNEDFLEYKSVKEAQDAGEKPCKHCKPRDMTISQERLKKGG